MNAAPRRRAEQLEDRRPGRLRALESAGQCRRTGAARDRAKLPPRCQQAAAELAIVLTDDSAMRLLNRTWRGVDAATNVLSFPAATRHAERRTGASRRHRAGLRNHRARGARRGQAFRASSRALAVHGFLHLLGYDHEREADADDDGTDSNARSCARLAIPDPYRRELAEAADAKRARQPDLPSPDADRGLNTRVASPSNDPSEHGGLPMVVAQPAKRDEGWLTRVMRILFGWKAAATRADLEQVLTAEQPSPASRRKKPRCSRTFSACANAAIESVMVPRADIVAVQQDITSANWSRYSRSPAIRGSWSTTTRSTIRPAWCTSAT